MISHQVNIFKLSVKMNRFSLMFVGLPVLNNIVSSFTRMTMSSVLLVLIPVQETLTSKQQFTMASLRRRGTLARTIYNRMLVDEEHRNDPHPHVSKIKEL